MLLYGSFTSPYVRRVRAVAAELGLDYEMVDTAPADGQQKLRAASPIWRVPTAVIDGAVIWDSHVIIDQLLSRHGHGGLRPRPPVGAPGWAREQNLIHVADGALDAGINVFYLEREGVDVARTPYLLKQRERVASTLGWLERELHGAYFTDDRRFGLAELALFTALGWFQFRKRYPVDAHPGLTAFHAAHADRPSLAATVPVA
jgi:glutathione S-transferase